jgi:hypothetical protein
VFLFRDWLAPYRDRVEAAQAMAQTLPGPREQSRALEQTSWLTVALALEAVEGQEDPTTRQPLEVPQLPAPELADWLRARVPQSWLIHLVRAAAELDEEAE